MYVGRGVVTGLAVVRGASVCDGEDAKVGMLVGKAIGGIGEPTAGTLVGLSAAESLPQADSKAASRQNSPKIAVRIPIVDSIASATTLFPIAPAKAPPPLLVLGWRGVKENACPQYALGWLDFVQLMEAISLAMAAYSLDVTCGGNGYNPRATRRRTERNG